MKILLIFAVSAGLIFSGFARSEEIKVNQQFSGVGHATRVDTNGDGVFASALSFELKGAPGRATSTSLVESTAFTPGDCPDGVFTAHVVQQSSVQTFNDLSMLYSQTTAGRTCFDPSTSKITCETEGIYTGGTGRFQGATGSWVVACEIFLIGETMSATNGTLKGIVNVPH